MCKFHGGEGQVGNCNCPPCQAILAWRLDEVLQAIVDLRAELAKMQEKLDEAYWMAYEAGRATDTLPDLT